jgi:NADPH:quinone reductase-like Zn-dependent oxidoreductase
MKAARVNQYGESDVIQVVDVDFPVLKPNQILVTVYAASLNPFDAFIRSGGMKEQVPVPFTTGGDFAGQVAAVAEGVTEFAVGDEVYGSANVINGGSGSAAETLAANVANTARKPDSVGFVTAAALPLVGASAVQALEEHMHIQSGQKILIHGGAGGIGHIAIQIAKAHGAFVATTVSSGDIEFVKSLGADQVIDYKKEKFDELLKDFDAVYDTIGGETTERSFTVLKKGGVLVSMKGPPNPERAQMLGVTAIGQGTKTNTEHLTRLRELVDTNKVNVHIETVFLLEQIKDAYDALAAHPQGKVVVKIDE